MDIAILLEKFEESFPTASSTKEEKLEIIKWFLNLRNKSKEGLLYFLSNNHHDIYNKDIDESSSYISGMYVYYKAATDAKYYTTVLNRMFHLLGYKEINVKKGINSRRIIDILKYYEIVYNIDDLGFVNNIKIDVKTSLRKSKINKILNR